jgi:hypothetical protein
VKKVPLVPILLSPNTFQGLASVEKLTIRASFIPELMPYFFEGNRNSPLGLVCMCLNF